MTSARKGSSKSGITPADLEEAKFDARNEELDALRVSLQFQKDRTTSTIRRAILLEIIQEIDTRRRGLANGEL